MNKGIIVIKVGTSTLTAASGGLDKGYIDSLASQIGELAGLGYNVALVTSGAIGAGMDAAGLSARPKELAMLQACAAIGQGRLMSTYEESFRKKGFHAAQILLTQDDFSDRRRFINAKHTILALLESCKAVPVINENDTIATDEIKFGDNDKLSYLVAGLLGAHTLILLTDVDGLYSYEEKKVVPLVSHISRDIEKMVQSKKSSLGSGGMLSKIKAAKAAMDMGIACIIANGREKDILLRIVNKEQIGTTFLPIEEKQAARERWLAFAPVSKGRIIVDDGAKEALLLGKKSLLAAGIRKVSGGFNRGDVVSVVDLKGNEFAKGVCGFSSSELDTIKGLKTQEIEKRLGRKISANEVMHRDNLVILK